LPTRKQKPHNRRKRKEVQNVLPPLESRLFRQHLSIEQVRHLRHLRLGTDTLIRRRGTQSYTRLHGISPMTRGSGAEGNRPSWVPGSEDSRWPAGRLPRVARDSSLMQSDLLCWLLLASMFPVRRFALRLRASATAAARHNDVPSTRDGTSGPPCSDATWHGIISLLYGIYAACERNCDCFLTLHSWDIRQEAARF
jgi:hypothetical protein